VTAENPSASRLRARMAAVARWLDPGRGWSGTIVLILVVLAVGAHLRFVGVDWDQGYHLHPDERFLTMVTEKLELPKDFLGYLDSDTSPLNPRNRGYAFFSYGTLPITITRILGEWVDSVTYDSVHLVGRRMSAAFDTLTILLVFMLGARLYGRRTGVLAAALTAVTALHIQHAHFYTVDAAMVAFMTLALYGLAGMVKRPNPLDLLLAGLGLGGALGSKVAAWPLVVVAVVAIGLRELFPRRPERDRRPMPDAESDDRPSQPDSGTAEVPPPQRWWSRPGPWGWFRTVALVGALGLVSLAALKVAAPDIWAGPGWPNVVRYPPRFVEVTAGTQWSAPSWWRTARDLMPDSLEMYVLPDPRWAHSMEQIKSQVTGFGMDWPPNHQWWGRKAYWFPWKNMVLWGMGLPLGLAASAGWLAAGIALFRGDRRHLLPWLFATLYFGFYGIQWAKSIRYMFAVYPAFIVMAAWGTVALVEATRGRRREWRRAALLALALVVGGTATWGFMFSRIYTRDHSRVAGSKWIYHNVPTAFGLRVAEGSNPELRGSWLPAAPASQLTFDGYAYNVEDEGWRGPMRVPVPGDEGEQPLRVDAVRLAYVGPPSTGPSAELVEVRIGSGPGLAETGDPDGALASGSASLESVVADKREHVVVDLEEDLLLDPAGEYYLWVRAAEGGFSGRPALLAYETRWDDIIPMSMNGYVSYDNEETSYGEGLFGAVVFDMYGEDDPGWLDRTLENLRRIDYWVSSSNRVYDSTAQLPMRFPATNAFYRDALFGEGFGFEHTADIHSYPNLGPLEINDQPAEEAFHVYDHPRVNVFRRTAVYDEAQLRAHLEPLFASRRWRYPPVADDPINRLLDQVLGRIPLERAFEASTGGATGAPGSEAEVADSILLDEAQLARQRAGGTWSDLFDIDGPLARWPVLAAVVWYLALAVIGAAAFPVVALALPRLADRGWTVARTAGLLLVSWAAWLAASLGAAPHRPWLVWAGLGLLAGASFWVVKSGRFEARSWLMANRRRLLVAELVTLGLFVAFLGLRAVNPDLWHPWYGGEKPMDLAYLNAILRSEAFPPYDPWFAGGRMNYYYFGFVMVGALIELTRVVPWIAYNLAIPTLACLTGAGVYGAVSNALIASGVAGRAAAAGGGLGAVLGVVSGNLFQVTFLFDKLAAAGRRAASIGFDATGASGEPTFANRLAEAAGGALAVLRGEINLDVALDHWYWNASRAIPHPPTEAVPITEFPAFTFLYADLHAHAMAMPVAMFALAIALAWALPGVGERPLAALARLGLGALAIGALWPTNTWDFPTYGLVAAGALAIGAHLRSGRYGAGWALRVAAVGVPLLGISLLLFLPYHATNVQPYTDVNLWRGSRTPIAAYLSVHGIFLAAMLPWAALSTWRRLIETPQGRRAALERILLVGIPAATLGVVAFLWSRTQASVGFEPDIWLPLVALGTFVLGAELALSDAEPADRFAGWLMALGAALTLAVEHIVLAGDISRMNTVFKFYIHVWLIWSFVAAYAAVRLTSGTRRPAWASVWSGMFAVLVLCGLLYTVTAVSARAKSRWPALGDVPAEARANWNENWRPGLSGMAFLEYAVYDGDTGPLHLWHDRDAFLWMLENIDGTPVVLEGFWDRTYSWRGRYSVWTGLPTVVGWDWHQTQQRAAGPPGSVARRVADVKTIYGSPDEDQAWRLMREYRVEYAVVGELERDIYPAEGLAKFDRWVEDGRAEVVYSNDGVQIYRLVIDSEGAPEADPVTG